MSSMLSARRPYVARSGRKKFAPMASMLRKRHYGAMSDWVKRAEALAPQVEQFRAEIEQQRCLPGDLERAIRDGGFFSLWVPRELGGNEVDLETMLRVVEAFARQDGSVGWNVMIAANDGLLWGYLKAAVARDMMAGDAGSVIAGSILAGAGTATQVSGG